MSTEHTEDRVTHQGEGERNKDRHPLGAKGGGERAGRAPKLSDRTNAVLYTLSKPSEQLGSRP